MPPSLSAPAISDTDCISVQVLRPRVILTTFIGRSTRAVAESAWEKFRNVITSMESPIWVSDATRLTGFDPRTLALGPRWFAAFKQRGGKHCLVVSEWEIAIMAASTMALGLGVRIRNFARIADATSAASNLLESE